jgi:hypothetical protein
MNGQNIVLGSFIGAVCIITWRDFKNPDPAWPLPVPPPYRYVGAGVAFGLLAIVADTLNDKIAGTIAFGLLIGLAYQTASNPTKNNSATGSVGGSLGSAGGGVVGGLGGATRPYGPFSNGN